MKNSRREFVKKLGVAAATASGVLSSFGVAVRRAKAAENPPSKPPKPPPKPDTSRTEGPGPVPLSRPAAGALCVLTYARINREPQVGALQIQDRSKIVDIGAVAQRLGTKLSFDPAQMLSFLASGKSGRKEMEALLPKAQPEEILPLTNVQLLAPIPVPSRNIYGVGWNYRDHVEEAQKAAGPDKNREPMPEHPVFFTKGTHTVNEPFGSIPYDPKISTTVDWGVGLAVVIGRQGKNIPEDEALDHVFGYTVINDITARDVQQKRHGGQWFKGKSLDGYGPMGPWIVAADGLDHDNLRLQTRVNGVVKQDANTRQMVFKVPRLIAELSAGMTLEPGDVIATGTPGGVGYTRQPPEFLKPPDELETEIVGIGTIRNTIQAAVRLD